MVEKEAKQPTQVARALRGGMGEARVSDLLAAPCAQVRKFSRIVLSPGASIGVHVHEAETELFYFLSGAGVVEEDGVRMAVAAGDSAVIGAGHAHGVFCAADEPLALVAVIVRGGGCATN